MLNLINYYKKLLKLIVYRKQQYLIGISLKMVRIRIDDSGSGGAPALINDQDIDKAREMALGCHHLTIRDTEEIPI